MRCRVVPVLAFLVVTGCASLPLKQQAVVGLQASETALEASHDAERVLCSPTADQSKAITRCAGAAAASIGLTDARHQQLAALYSKAFDIEINAATALKVWRAGDPKPSSLSEYERAVQDIIALIVQFIPASETTAIKAQAANTEAKAVAKKVGG